MEFWSKNKIFRYLRLNKKYLEKITKQKIISASYPFGIINNKIIKSLKDLNIEVSFKKNTYKKKINTLNSIPRVNHNYFNKIYK